eukprot:356408-Lingulodinium_polyedra.AAC.1
MTHQSYVRCVQVGDVGEARKAHRRRWKDTCLEIPVNLHDEDTDALRQAAYVEDQVVYVLRGVRRKSE